MTIALVGSLLTDVADDHRPIIGRPASPPPYLPGPSPSVWMRCWPVGFFSRQVEGLAAGNRRAVDSLLRGSDSVLSGAGQLSRAAVIRRRSGGANRCQTANSPRNSASFTEHKKHYRTLGGPRQTDLPANQMAPKTVSSAEALGLRQTTRFVADKPWPGPPIGPPAAVQKCRPRRPTTSRLVSRRRRRLVAGGRCRRRLVACRIRRGNLAVGRERCRNRC